MKSSLAQHSILVMTLFHPSDISLSHYGVLCLKTLISFSVGSMFKLNTPKPPSSPIKKKICLEAFDLLFKEKWKLDMKNVSPCEFVCVFVPLTWQSKIIEKPDMLISCQTTNLSVQMLWSSLYCCCHSVVTVHASLLKLKLKTHSLNRKQRQPEG